MASGDPDGIRRRYLTLPLPARQRVRIMEEIMEQYEEEFERLDMAGREVQRLSRPLYLVDTQTETLAHYLRILLTICTLLVPVVMTTVAVYFLPYVGSRFQYWYYAFVLFMSLVAVVNGIPTYVNAFWSILQRFQKTCRCLHECHKHTGGSWNESENQNQRTGIVAKLKRKCNNFLLYQLMLLSGFLTYPMHSCDLCEESDGCHCSDWRTLVDSDDAVAGTEDDTSSEINDGQQNSDTSSEINDGQQNSDTSVSDVPNDTEDLDASDNADNLPNAVNADAAGNSEASL